MRVESINIYKFDELSEQAKEKAREWYRRGIGDFEWWDFIYDHAKSIGGLMGIEIEHIYFSGFSSQGDGACFVGSYKHQKGAYKAVKAYAPKDQELHQIARALNKIQKAYFYRLTANVKQTSWHYSHEYTVSVEVETTEGASVPKLVEDALADEFRDYMRWIYKRLEEEWDYMNSDEQVDDSIRANEYEFEESGESA